jgi:hypothetical protein
MPPAGDDIKTRGDVSPHAEYVKARAIVRRGRTLSVVQLRRELRDEETTPRLAGVVRPRVRADCKDGPRPCPFVSCKYHLYLDANPYNGSIKMNFPDEVEPDEIPATCVLDVADEGGVTLEEVGILMNLTRERVRQLEDAALKKLFEAAKADAALPRRRLPLIDRELLSDV